MQLILPVMKEEKKIIFVPGCSKNIIELIIQDTSGEAPSIPPGKG